MTTNPTSRKPIEASTPLTLAQVREQILVDEDLSLRRRQDIGSALNTCAKALQRPIDELPAHPSYLQKRLKGFVPAMAGLSASRWRNVLSLVRFALDHAGVAHVPGRYREPLAPDWQVLFDHLKDYRKRFGLSRLARYCSVQGIAANQVDDAVLERYLEDLETDGLIKAPRTVHRTACQVWNEASAAIEVWPKHQLKVPSYMRTYTLPWSSFPASLEADLDGYLHRLAATDIFADFDLSPLKLRSIKLRRSQFHQFASALVCRGRDPQSLRSIADLVPVETVKEGLRFYLQRKDPAKKHAFDIAVMLKAAARHWVKVDAAHLEQLKAICRNLNPGQHGMTPKNRARLRPFDDPLNVHAIVTLPERLIATLPGIKGRPRTQALIVQAALAIEFLLMVPMRLNNLVGIDLERQLIRSRGGVVHLAVSGGEIKNGVDIEAVLPAQTVRLLDLYLDRYRSLLSDGPSPWLFPGKGVKPKSDQALRLQISGQIKRHCGLDVHPHLFRGMGAKFYLDAHPGAYGLLRLVHGHKSVDTTTKYYCGMETPAAMRHFDEHVLKLKAATPVAPLKRGAR